MDTVQGLVGMGYAVLDNDYRSSNGEIFKLGYKINDGYRDGFSATFVAQSISSDLRIPWEDYHVSGTKMALQGLTEQSCLQKGVALFKTFLDKELRNSGR